MNEHRCKELLLPSCAPWGKALDNNKSLCSAMYKGEKDQGYVCLMVPEDLPSAVAKSTLRWLQQNGRKMGKDQRESRLQQRSVCVLPVSAPHRKIPPQLPVTSSEQWLNAPVQPCLSPCPACLQLFFFMPLRAYRYNEWEREAKADDNRVLFSPKLTPGATLYWERDGKLKGN